MTGEEVVSTGICVSEQRSCLGCSPDGLVEQTNIIEVKCPYAARNELTSPETVHYLEKNEYGLSLKKKHDYFYQVQGTLLYTGRNMCSFVVWTLKDMVIINIPRDEIFISEMLEKLHIFYREYFRDALLKKHFYRSSHMFYAWKPRIEISII